MADIIIKPASGSDALKLQDGAGTDIVTVSTNHVKFSKGICESISAVSSSSGVLTLNLATATVFTCTLTENITSWVFSNAVNTQFNAWTVVLTQHASSAKTVAYQAAVKWGGGVDHVMSTATGSKDIISMFTLDGGTTIYASVAGTAFA